MDEMVMSVCILISVVGNNKDTLIDLINKSKERFTKEELGELVDLLVGCEIDYTHLNVEVISIYLNFINEYRKAGNNEEDIRL